MSTTELVRWWRDGERLLVDVEGTKVQARWLKFEEQLVTLQCGPHGVDEFTHEQSRSSVPAIEKTRHDERLGLHEDDPLLDEGLW